jgi:predicted Zn finger-like uncharacterized protein
MRLICPVCSAQYDVDADLIPPGGRDVECSACGKVWFVGPGRLRATASEHATDADRGRAAGASASDPGEAEGAADAGAAEGVTVAQTVVARPTVTPAIAGILRAEAERERANRAAGARAALERQEDMQEPEGRGAGTAEADITAQTGSATTGARGEADELAAAIKKIVTEETTPTARPEPAPVVEDVPPPRPAVSIEVPEAAVRAVEPPPEVPAPTSTASRRDRLPDIEEISSTLSPAPVLPPPHDVAPRARRRSGGGFRLGIGLALILASVLAMVYLNAQRIIAALPESEPYIRTYTTAVDESRLWLDVQLQHLLKQIGAEAQPGSGG